MKYDKDKADEAKETKRIEDAKALADAQALANAKEVTGGETPSAEGTSTFQKPLPLADANTPEENKIIYKGITYNDEGNHDNIKLVDDGKGGKMFVSTVPDKEVVAVIAEDGKVDYYEKKDVDGAGMTLTTKILIGVGAVVVLGLITFLIIKRRK